MRYFLFCHRLPDRTFNIKGWYFPVCSRCTGIYLGILLCYGLIHILNVEYNFWTVLVAFLSILPTFIDGSTQFIGFRDSNNKLRFSSGFIAGFGLLIIAKWIKFSLGINWSLIS
jgi:uncharacterized membrane protein